MINLLREQNYLVYIILLTYSGSEKLLLGVLELREFLFPHSSSKPWSTLVWISLYFLQWDLPAIKCSFTIHHPVIYSKNMKWKTYVVFLDKLAEERLVWGEAQRLFKVIFQGKGRAVSKEERNSGGRLSPGSPLQPCPELSLALAEGPQAVDGTARLSLRCVIPPQRDRERGAEVTSHESMSPLHLSVISPALEW